MNIKGSIILFSLLATSFSVAYSSPLTVKDYCAPGFSAPKSVKEMTPLADGESYAAISEDGKSIETFSYKTGKKTGVLFSISGVKGDIKIPEFDGYEISDNGRKILLWNNVNKIYRHSFTADYYVYDTMRSTLAKVSENGPQRNATMSHDGRLVAYTRENNIYVSNIDYKTDIAVTKDGAVNQVINGSPDWGYEEEFSVVNTMRWSADDSVLAFIRFDESNVPTYSFDDYRSYCSSDPLGDPYPAQYKYKYPLAGYPNSVVSVHAYNVDNRVVKKMDLPISETDYVPSMEFDGNGERLMVMILNRDQNNLRLFSVSPASTVGKQILTETSEAWLSPKAYQMVKYGKTSFVIGSDRSGYRHLYQYDYNGTLKRQITKGEFYVTDYYGADPRTGIHYMQTTSLGSINRNVASVDAKGVLRLMNKEEGTASARFSKNFAYYLLSYSNATLPTQYRLYNIKGAKLADVELNSAYAQKYAEAPKMEFLKVKNAVGEEMDAYIIKPSDFDPSKKYPLLMTQYNGPESQEVKNQWKMGGMYYFASQGYVVACVDGRGSGFRNTAWTYSVYKQLGILEAQDQIAGANYFASLPYIDSSRVACFGWSYGGYMTLMELGSKGSPFKAGVAMAPVTDWRFYDSIYTERYMLTPGQNTSGYEKSSALAYTGNVDARLLIMSGTSDDNVHFYNTLKYVSKLNSEGGIFDMMAYAGFEHSLGMCNAREQLYRKVLDFLNLNLK